MMDNPATLLIALAGFVFDPAQLFWALSSALFLLFDILLFFRGWIGEQIAHWKEVRMKELEVRHVEALARLAEAQARSAAAAEERLAAQGELSLNVRLAAEREQRAEQWAEQHRYQRPPGGQNEL